MRSGFLEIGMERAALHTNFVQALRLAPAEPTP